MRTLCAVVMSAWSPDSEMCRSDWGGSVFTHHVDRHYGAWSTPDERTAYLNQLFVAPAARGKGIATMLIDDLLLHAGKADRQVVRCLVAPDNAASLRAFERSGAVPIADLRGLRLGSRWTLRLSRRSP